MEELSSKANLRWLLSICVWIERQSELNEQRVEAKHHKPLDAGDGGDTQRPIRGGHDPVIRLGEIQDRLRREANPSHQVIYTSIIDFMYDAFLAFIKVIVGQVGWSTDGYARGYTSTAERFFKGILSYVSSSKETPLHPGAHRHFLLGRDIYPSSAKGIMRMPEWWCVFNGNRTDYLMVMKQLDYAFVVFRFQGEKACRFDGLSIITVENPSTPECMLPIEVVRGEQENY
ncbi:hypothetical protein SASPL_126861 [Salvia splendens]|uniref:Uncharacterized protein n=1 Tax=Salvia splendens TaxID=180675 RepID=A0A8X8XIF9_SALSN|nr:hypothetical protein SASPL_126861 [Salvia splendens]